MPRTQRNGEPRFVIPSFYFVILPPPPPILMTNTSYTYHIHVGVSSFLNRFVVFPARYHPPRWTRYLLPRAIWTDPLNLQFLPFFLPFRASLHSQNPQSFIQHWALRLVRH